MFLGILSLVSTATPAHAAADPTTAVVTVNSTSITADGTSTSTITLDTLDPGATNELVVFSKTGSGTIGSTTNVGDGTYTAIYTSSLTAGDVTITATIGGAAVADNATITQTPGTATKAVIATQPSGAVNATVFTTQPVVNVTDANDNINTGFTGNVVASIATGTGTLSGTTTVAAVSGVATFTDLEIAGTAGAFTLTFTPASLTAATSSSFNLTDQNSAPAPSSAAAVYTPTTPQTALVLTSSASSVAWGSSVKLTLAGGSGTGAVTYSSTGTTFCAVNPSGNLTPVSAGTCTVTANKDGDGTYGSAQSNSITITATENAVASTSSTSNSGVAMVVGKPVGGVATVKFTVADTYAGEKVSVILATKSSSGKTLYKTLGSAKVGTTGAVSFKTKVKLPVGAVLQLKSAGTVILSKSIK